MDKQELIEQTKNGLKKCKSDNPTKAAIEWLLGQGLSKVEAAEIFLAAQPEPTFPNATAEAIEKMQEADYFSDDKLSIVESVLRARINDEGLEQINKFLTKSQTRTLTFREMALGYLAHRKNCEKNDGGASPIEGIVGLSKAMVTQGILDKPLCRLHVSTILQELVTIQITSTDGVYRKGKAKRYKMLPNALLDSLI